MGVTVSGELLLLLVLVLGVPSLLAVIYGWGHAVGYDRGYRDGRAHERAVWGPRR